MQYTYEFLRKCHGLRFRATIDDKQEEGIIKVAPNTIELCYGEPNPGNLMTFERWRVLNVCEDAFNYLPKDFEIVPRDPETYTDWQIGDKIIVDKDEEVRSVIFRCGEVVLFKDSKDRCCPCPYTCKEFYDDGYRLVLTDVEKEVLEEKKCVEDTPKPYEFKKGEPVMVRNYDGFWEIKVFTKMQDGRFKYMVTTNGVDECGYRQCIPYNEETMHLLGTTEDCGQ